MRPKHTVHLNKEPRGSTPDSASLACEHCESPLTPDSPHPLGLCPVCAAVDGIVLLYVRRRGWTPQREARIRLYTRRARLQLPLFDPDVPFDLPVDSL